MPRPTLPALPLLALLVGACGPRHHAGPDPCAGRGTSIVIETRDHTLWLCEADRSAGHYPVALGKGGVGKTTAGDGKTPLGTYALGAPRLSARFHRFIPVGYPTAAEAAAGASGGDIGIHGPSRAFRWAGRLTLLRDWTRGCIALSHDRDLDAVARWMETARPATVVLE